MSDVSQIPTQPKPKLLDRVRHEIRTRPSNILPGPARPLKKAQMQGGARGAARGVLRLYVAASRERANAADGPFFQRPGGHSDVRTTAIYTHVLNRGWGAVRSPADRVVRPLTPGRTNLASARALPCGPLRDIAPAPESSDLHKRSQWRQDNSHGHRTSQGR